ncbi:Clr6 associated factor 2, Laf2 [Schizosaccharomyces pombe]|uniref:SWIRM domain-containing protein laf2 n=1 Tax=Schizosaccharomyces pombe (strain 972 / ATCC 24843) TaxID=284812 RepID=LAF2_SCHPO|nr:Clr6-associated factor 2 Laf2 [Schizosaccharomyces pombe]O74443.1 RecName: Full=SWIRM domain-containing protein laf2; AltName: Full=Clr6 L-associated factor 2 [Schizosaccharomyces pombe 972h-]CAA20679.1 Clr6 associated factor 2, Laf2 [Schizosaccharomyces pombe]|eukprot:NP_587806.1 Clr6-associated factor 2 Laf2 [Schizosaccharomyces pombe]
MQILKDQENLNPDGGSFVLITPPLSPPKQKSLSYTNISRRHGMRACMKGIVYEVYKNQPKLWLQQELIWLRRKRIHPIPKARRNNHVGRWANRHSNVSSSSGSRGRSSVSSRDSSPSYSGALRSAERSISSSPSTIEARRRKSARGNGLNGAIDVANLPFEELPNFCPDMSVLDNRTHPRTLKAEWKGPPLDLSDDPYRDLLHPAELHLASTLRLPCLIYLDNKKRIFAEWHHRRQQGLTFRKTDAQRASRVDVNKASRLWKAFHEVGFFDD